MPQAQITINAVAGSEIDLPIGTLVQFDNDNIGGEVSFAWTIVDQPDGPTDALSSPTIQNPTFTPNKEGSYLIKLVVNQSLASEQEDTVIAAVLQVKTLERIPAAGETTETDARGWADDLNSLLRRTDELIADRITELVVEAASNVAQGDVVRITGVATLKSGLPGEEDVIEMDKALATVPADLDGLLGVVEDNVDGTTTLLAGELMRVRLVGLFSQTLTGAAAVGDDVFVSDAGTLSLTPGTNVRRVGEVAATPTGSTFRVVINGFLPLPAPLPTGYVDGLRVSFASVSTVGIAVGVARDGGDTLNIDVTAPLIADITASGVNGLDVGVEAANTWYALYLIADSSGVNPVASLLSASFSLPVAPAGYDRKRYIGAVRNDSGSDFLKFFQRWNGRTRRYVYDVDDLDNRVLISGNATVFTNVDCSSFVPPRSDFAMFRYEFGIFGASESSSFRVRPAGGTGDNFIFRRAIAGGDTPRNYLEMALSGQAIEYAVFNALNQLTLAVLGFDDEV